MPNIKSSIHKQNTSPLNNQDNKINTKQCNCRSAKNCPQNRKRYSITGLAKPIPCWSRIS